MEIYNPDHYRESLRIFLLDKMKLCLPNTSPEKEADFVEVRRKLVDNAFDQWEICFTHRSINPNPGHNYENMELLGDQIMSLEFIYYLQQIFPGINESQLSELKVAYLQTNQQAKLSVALGLPEYLRSWQVEIAKQIPEIQEDLLEAFFGTLYVVGNNIFGLNYGSILTRNMLVALFYQRVDFNKSLGNPKTRVKEILEVLPFGTQNTVNEILRTEGDAVRGFVARIILPNEMLRAISSTMAGLPRDGEIARSSSKSSKSEAETEAFEIAAPFLENLIGPDNIAMFKHSVNLQKEDAEKLREKIMASGYQRAEFARTDKLPIVQLIGVRSDGSREVIYTKTRETGISLNDQYKELAKNYLAQQ